MYLNMIKEYNEMTIKVFQKMTAGYRSYGPEKCNPVVVQI